MPQKFALMAAALALLASAGCFSQPYPQKNYFSLRAELPPATEARPAGRRTLLLGSVTAAAGFEDRSLVYRVGPNQFEADFYNELVAAPARLLADLAAQYLDGANSKLRVLRSPGQGLADFGLEIYLESMYGDLTAPEPAAAVNVRFALGDLRPARPRALLTKTYHCRRALTDKGSPALAAGLNACVNDILAELNQDIEGTPF